MAVSPAVADDASSPVRLAGWGGGARVDASMLTARTVADLQAALTRSDEPMLVRGMGRSYGDAAQLSDGLMIDGRRRARISVDLSAGLAWAQGGATLGQILAEAAPFGWMLPVLPGTQHVTVGGAIACDVHGKNHAAVGAFGRHVRRLGLLTADGAVHTLSGDGEAELLQATIGGLGLTGVILWAELALVRIPLDGALSVDTTRVASLDDALGALDASRRDHRVAWLDLISAGHARGVVTCAGIVSGPAAHGSLRRDLAPRAVSSATVRARARIPSRWSRQPLSPRTVRAYNELRYRSAPRDRRDRLGRLGSFLFPLDALDAWPRLYGADGLVQYQCVVPRGEERALDQILDALRRSRLPCFLAVLKDLGDAGPAPLSFPIGGWTLALDLPRGSPGGLELLLRHFDAIVIESGGRVYFAKDGRLTASAVEAMYPRLAEWRAVRDRVDPERRWRSDLALRAGLVSP